MMLAGEIMFAVLVYLNLATLWSLGPPWTYRERKVAWYLSLTVWSTLLFDAVFLAAVTGFASRSVAEILMLIGLGLRIIVSMWLLRMVQKRGTDGN